MLRVPFSELYEALSKAMLALGLRDDRAQLCARLFAETTRDGVYSHGLNRFPRFEAMVQNGTIDVNAEPTRISGLGSLERWDGHRGPGNLNAHAAIHRAIALARQNGIGGVALGNTNHWMRGGNLRLDRRRSRPLCPLLVQHPRQRPCLGSDHSLHRQQSPRHRRPAQLRPRRHRHGRLAILLWQSRLLRKT